MELMARTIVSETLHVLIRNNELPPTGWCIG